MEMQHIQTQNHSNLKDVPYSNITMVAEDNLREPQMTKIHSDVNDPPDLADTTMDTTFEPKEHLTPLLKIFTFFTALGGATFGYDIGVISGAVIQLRREFNLSTVWTEVIVSITVGTAAIGALTGGFLSDFLGRRRTVLIASATFTGGALMMGLAPGKEVLLVGRMIVGIGIGKSCLLYLDEKLILAFFFCYYHIPYSQCTDDN